MFRAGEFNALPRAAVVGPLVGAGRVVVLDMDGLNVHGEWSLAVVGSAASPFNSTFAVARIATSPDANPQVHGSLGEPGAALGLLIRNGTDLVSINQPGDGVLRPVDGVGVHGVDRSVDGRIRLTVVGGGVTLAEVVGLDLVVETAKTLL